MKQKSESTMKVRVKNGKLDLEDLENRIKKLIPGYPSYKFDYDGNKVWVSAELKDQPEMVELFVFVFFSGEPVRKG